MASSLQAKQLMADMLNVYQQASQEDTAFEAALTVFARKKELDFLRDKETEWNRRNNESYIRTRRSSANRTMMRKSMSPRRRSMVKAVG